VIVETGHFALVLAFALALFQTIVPMYGAAVNDRKLMATAPTAALAQFFLVAVSFAALTRAYLVSDFSVKNVFANSHSAKPFIYKISGVWANHEGSLLLWVLILTLFGAGVAVFSGNLPRTLKARVLAVQGSVSTAFLGFILLTSNPFERLVNAPIEGTGMNPMLQDPALAIHPPLLYAGYVGMSVAFSFAIAALIEGRVDAAWARWVRPWTLAAWMFLTIGIAIGSWWAYYELGWGGWWFWDPVENASFMPWLVGTALLHSAIVVEKRNALKVWTILLAILAFSMSLIGTFIVRSGVITSVHAFASDPTRGIFILGILCFFVGGALVLFAWRAPILKAGGIFAPISREGSLVVNNLLLAVAAFAVFIGTLYPLFYEAFSGGGKISVGPPFFNPVFGILILPLLLLLPIGPLLSWKRADILGAMQRLWAAALAAVIVIGIVMMVKTRGPWAAPLGIGLGIWLIVGPLVEMAERTRFLRAPFGTFWSRLKGLPGAAIGMTMAHLGVGITVIGIVAITAWKVEKIVVLKHGESVEIGGSKVTFVSETPGEGPNYSAETGRFDVTVDGKHITTLISEKRIFRPSRRPTTEVGIHPYWSGDLYVVMGDAIKTGGRTVRVYFNPLAPLIWLGALVMFLGGMVSLFDRRYRIGAPKRAKQATIQAAE
jgi:cytochrome c-type biogenesis protein CcmF